MGWKEYKYLIRIICFNGTLYVYYHLQPLLFLHFKWNRCFENSAHFYHRSASSILFGQGTKEQLQALDEGTLLSVFEGVPQFEVSRDTLSSGVKIADLLTEQAAVLPSKGELRKLIAAGGLSLNKEKVTSPEDLVGTEHLIAGRFLLVQRGKKNYYLLIVN